MIASGFVAMLLAGGEATAQTFTEVGDAGQTQGSAQATALTQSGTIFGSINSVNDADVFSLVISNTSTVQFSTVNTLTGTSGGLGGLDTELFLFTSAGIPIFANDDANGFSLQSFLPAGNSLLTTLTAGTYYVAISLSGNDPVNTVNQLVFATASDTTSLRGAASGTSPKNWSGFDSGAFSGPTGAYQIDISVVPEPSTIALYAVGLLLMLLAAARRKSFARINRIARNSALGLAALALAHNASARQDVPANLGNGLDRLVKSNAEIKEAQSTKTKITTYVGTNGKSYTTSENAALGSLALSEKETGRLLVRINLDGSIKPEDARTALPLAVPSLQITALDPTYRGVGVLNALVSVDDVPDLARAPGVRSVILELKPRHSKGGHGGGGTPGQNYPNLGTFFDQGVIQHRVDLLNQYYNASAPVDFQGAGLSIACISNSFAANTAHPASLDVTNNDLPGNGSNPVGNTTPVFVLLDDLASTTSDDEGRGMCQIVYHMAPKARVGFATADVGEVGFANAIRGLAGINSADFPNASTDGFAADVICDDVGYFDEPFYQDGIIGAGVNDAAAAGVSYFSSAANDIGVNGYESVIRSVPNGTGLTFAAGNTALINTNINLAGVPTNLYAGGFHNFNPSGDPTKQDVAQTVNVAASSTVQTVLEWNDPYDQNLGVTLGSQIYQNSGTYVATPVVFDNTSTPPLPALNAGQAYVLTEVHTSGTYDAVVSIIKPDGTALLTQDTGVDETVVFTAPVSGNYKLSFDHFSTTTGSFTFTVNEASITQFVGSDWNLLAFRTDTGAYVASSSLTTDNLASNEPVELGYVNRTSSTVTSIQYVLARSNTPSGPHVADHIRYLLPANGRSGYGPAEYFTYNTVTTAGHAMATGCNGTAAYSVFRPNIPESFTSPGPVTIYWDQNQNYLNPPQVRLQPGVAAADAANISVNEGLAGLGSDATSDYDVAANFSGTSAAAPHAAACALLVLEAHGGRHSVTPAQMTEVLHQSSFQHDLDPNASGSSTRATNGGKVTLTFVSDNSSNAGTGVNDPNSLTIAYTGASYIKTIVFNPLGTAATAGNVTAGNNGLDVSNNYFSNLFPGVVWQPTTKAFTVGSGSVGLTSADVSAAYTNIAGPPSTTQTYTMTLTFSTSNFTGGKILRFTVGRAIQHSSVVPSGTTSANYSADLFGGGVVIPEGTVINNGMAYSGTLGDGSTFSGIITNRIGAGYSNLDGFGFINAQAATTTALP